MRDSEDKDLLCGDILGGADVMQNRTLPKNGLAEKNTFFSGKTRVFRVGRLGHFHATSIGTQKCLDLTGFRTWEAKLGLTIVHLPI